MSIFGYNCTLCMFWSSSSGEDSNLNLLKKKEKKTGVISIYTTRTFKHHIKHAVYMSYDKCLLFMEFNIHIHITKKNQNLKQRSLYSLHVFCQNEVFRWKFLGLVVIHAYSCLFLRCLGPYMYADCCTVWTFVHCWIWSVHHVHWSYFK